MAAVEAGAEDITSEDDAWEVLTAPADLAQVRSALEQAGVVIERAELEFRPSTLVPLDESQASSLMRLIEALEESDDVGEVHANFDVPAEVLERVAG